MTQQRLFRLAPESFILSANYIAGEGWSVSAGMRRQDESWSDVAREQYCHLTTDELTDVICSLAESLLLARVTQPSDGPRLFSDDGDHS